MEGGGGGRGVREEEVAEVLRIKFSSAIDKLDALHGFIGALVNIVSRGRY